MMAAEDRHHLAEIRNKTRGRLRAVLGSACTAALLDFPLHENAGDSLIWLGEIGHLRALGVDVGYRADCARYSRTELVQRVPDGPVLFHGGGNLGDLWPYFEQSRLRAVTELRDRRLIILSQSVYFRDRANAKHSNFIYRSHPDLTLLVRDTESLSRARRDLPDVRSLFCCDMAFGYEPPKTPRPAAAGVVHLSRTDHEKSRRIGSPDWLTVDWGLTGHSRAMWAVSRIPGIVRKRTPILLPTLLAGLNQRMYDYQARLNVDDATRKLSQGRVVVTDRLHAHVLCVLLGIPHVVMDNVYGKIGAMYRGYSGQFLSARFATSGSEVFEQCEDLLHATYGVTL